MDDDRPCYNCHKPIIQSYKQKVDKKIWEKQITKKSEHTA